MRPEVLGPLCAFLSSVTWVTGSGAYSHLSRRYVPGVVNFNRALVALPLFALVVFFARAEVAQTLVALGTDGIENRAAWLSVSIVASYVLGDGMFLYAALSLGFTAAQAIAAIYPIWATLAAIILHGETLHPLGALGLVLAVVGVLIVVLSTKGTDHVPAPERLAYLRNKSIGVVLALVCSLAWGLNSFAVSRGGQGIHFALGNMFRMAIATVLCPIIARMQGARGLRLDAADYRRFLPIIAFEAFVGSAVYMYGLSHSPVAIGATLSSLAPVLSVPVAIALRWERFSWRKTIGVCVVVAGLALLLA